jgi:hypothetical protein
MVAKTYVCKNKCKPEVITEPTVYIPKCHRCGEYMVEGRDE